MPSKSDWISTEEELPKPNDYVLGWRIEPKYKTKRGGPGTSPDIQVFVVEFVAYENGEVRWMKHGYENLALYKITHWMPLPKAPNAQ